MSDRFFGSVLLCMVGAAVVCYIAMCAVVGLGFVLLLSLHA